jgi:membrane associated rhomboid family serine protease
MNDYRGTIQLRAMTLLGLVGMMWIVWLLDLIMPGARSVAGTGIIPRTMAGLQGIPIAPFIHLDLDHLLSNSVPFIVLGALVMLRGIGEFLYVFIVCTLSAGAGTWLLGSTGQHIGASGVVFGLFGYLVFRTAFDRRWTSALITLAVAVAYGTSMTFGLVPQEHVSWSGHFFGFAGGLLAARMRYRNRAVRLRAAGPTSPSAW